MHDPTLLNDAVDILRACLFSYLATVDGDRPNMRVMKTAGVDADGTIWYAMHRSSPKMREISQNNNVCVVAWNPGNNLRVWGQAFEANAQEATEHFNPEFLRMFPDGAADPEYAMIKITISEIDLKHFDS